jgi:Tfp pilus assembly protein PilF
MRRSRREPADRRRGAEPETTARSHSRDAMWRRFMPILVVVATAIPFLPSLANDFVDWDDHETLVKNLNYRGLGFPQLYWMFTTFHMGHYQPLSWMTFAVDYLVWGMRPLGYHLTSLLLHAANALVFYLVCLRVIALAGHAEPPADQSLCRWSAGLSALLFGVHPLRVESVAWATERRDVLSGLFFLLTILFYLKANEPSGIGRQRRLVSSLGCYVISLLAKASGVTLPLVLCVFDVYPLRRWPDGLGQWRSPAVRKLILEKLPFFSFALIFGIVALLAQSDIGALRSFESYGPARRLTQAFYGIVFYLWKSLLPTNLSPIYAIPLKPSPADWLRFGLAGVLVVTLTIGLVYGRKRCPGLLAIWVYYLAVLLPVLGIAQSGPQIVADRYTYLSCLGWALLAGAGIYYLRRAAFLWGALAVFAVAGLAVASWRQTGVWRDSNTLWAHAVKSDPHEPQAHNYYGTALFNQGNIAGGIEQYREALRLEPAFKEAHHNLATVLVKQGSLNEAVDHFRAALKIDPNYKKALNNLGVVLALRGEFAESVEQFRAVLRLDPADREARQNLEAVQKRSRQTR